MDDASFAVLLQEFFDKGGSPEYLIVPGLGEMYWPSLSLAERAFVLGYQRGRKEERDAGNPS